MNMDQCTTTCTQAKKKGGKKGPHPTHTCNLIPADVPSPGCAQTVLHPRKDVFVLKVAKIGASGDKRTKLELELVTPYGPEHKVVSRVDTRETQCDPEPAPCSCCPNSRRKK